MSRAKNNQIPPQAVEAERSVLGAMLLNPDVVDPVVEILRESPSDTFFVEAHQHIYRAILSLRSKSKPLDSVSLMEEMSRANTLESAGGVFAIANLTSSVPTSANYEHYAHLVLDAANRRRIIVEAQTLIENAYSSQEPPESLVDEFNLCMAMRVQCVAPDNISTFEECLELAVDKIDRMYKTGNVGGIPTGISRLDVLFRGFRPGELTVVAAPPSVGKTAFALNIISNLAKMGKKTLIFSMEMPKEDLVQRVIYQRGSISEHWVLNRMISPEELSSRLNKAMTPDMKNIYMDDTMALTVKQIIARIRKHVAAHNTDLIVIDYLQLIATQRNGRESRAEEIGRVTREIKNIAGALKIPIVLLSQVTREGAKSEELQLYHLRESGDIEAHANNVLMLWRGEDKIVYCAIRKQRNGPTGKADLVFDRAIQLFRDYTPEDGDVMKKKSEKDVVEDLLGPVGKVEPEQEEFHNAVGGWWER